MINDDDHDRSSSNNNNNNKKKKKQQVVVGWPPVCSYRRKNNSEVGKKMYVKVSMDGAPFLRKIDLTTYKAYSHLLIALHNLFDCPGIGEALKDADSSEYAPIYEDKDGDWMLVGDVPWGDVYRVVQEIKDHEATRGKRNWSSCKEFPQGDVKRRMMMI